MTRSPVFNDGASRAEPHDLRHFMATEMLNDGTPIAVVASRLAHASASTTLNVYAHPVPGGDRAAAENLAWRLVGAAEDD
jgi:integrase